MVALLVAGSIPSLPCRNMAGNRQLAVAGLLPTAGHAGGWLAYRGHLCNDSQRRVQSMIIGANFIADRKFSGNLDLNSLYSQLIGKATIGQTFAHI